MLTRKKSAGKKLTLKKSGSQIVKQNLSPAELARTKNLYIASYILYTDKLTSFLFYFTAIPFGIISHFFRRRARLDFPRSKARFSYTYIHERERERDRPRHRRLGARRELSAKIGSRIHLIKPRKSPPPVESRSLVIGEKWALQALFRGPRANCFLQPPARGLVDAGLHVIYARLWV